jgi:ATP-dependent DNA ligase
VFDLLHQGKDSLLGLPCTQRRARLEELGLDAPPVRTPSWHRGGAEAVLVESIAKGLEGVVGKPLDSGYHPGQRRDWIKIKNVKQQEVIICGREPGEGRRADTIGSLLVGIYDGDQLRYAGHVGTGFTQDMLADLMGQMGSLGREESRSALMFRPRWLGARGGWKPSWSARSRSPSGPPTGSCASRAGAGYGSTRSLATCTAKTRCDQVSAGRAG